LGHLIDRRKGKGLKNHDPIKMNREIGGATKKKPLSPIGKCWGEEDTGKKRHAEGKKA